jgi:hypothetical protein
VTQTWIVKIIKQTEAVWANSLDEPHALSLMPCAFLLSLDPGPVSETVRIHAEQGVEEGDLEGAGAF